MNATDRVDAPYAASLVRAISHQPYSADLAPLQSIRSHASRHAHFDTRNPNVAPADGDDYLDRDEEDEEDEDETNREQSARAFDIEHVPVDDDPREWSRRKKGCVMALMTAAVLGPMISPSIYNPVVDEVQRDLGGTETQIGLSLSIYILLQGCIPLVWASTAEIIGRKSIYIASFVLYTIGSAVASRAPNMPVLIGMRCLQAMGSSAVLSVGAGSLADMYEIKERGQKLGIYYGMPMLGPTLGPLIGGALGNAYGWRSTMYFLAVFAAIMTLLFFFFPDTWRRERSRVYQKALSDALKRSLKAQAAAEKKRQRKVAKGLASTATTPAETRAGTPSGTRPGSPVTVAGSVGPDVDVERQEIRKQRKWLPKWLSRKSSASDSDSEHTEIKPSFRDVNPLPTMVSIFHSPTNAFVLCSSGLLFAAQYTTTYTASITFSRAPYSYNPLIIGIVLLSFGVGNIFGSVFGGRASDVIMKRLSARNGGVIVPEMRLKSTLPGMPLIIIAYLIYAWTADRKTSIAGPIVALFLAGFSLMFVYSSTLAYLVDSNPGRSASAVSCNSFCRGVGACVMSQVAIPLQNAIGDGGLYTLFAGVLCFACAGLVVIAYKGEQWRSPDHEWPWSNKSASKAKPAQSQSQAQSGEETKAPPSPAAEKVEHKVASCDNDGVSSAEKSKTQTQATPDA